MLIDSYSYPIVKYRVLKITEHILFWGQDYVSWDDDMDISMPRKDYEQFLKIAPRLLPKDLFLQTQQSDPQYKLPIAKIRKRGTLLIKTGETGNENYCHGIFIDIIPNDYYHNKWFIKWMRWGVTVRDRKKNYYLFPLYPGNFFYPYFEMSCRNARQIKHRSNPLLLDKIQQKGVCYVGTESFRVPLQLSRIKPVRKFGNQEV